jgi:hypothetical protein
LIKKLKTNHNIHNFSNLTAFSIILRQAKKIKRRQTMLERQQSDLNHDKYIYNVLDKNKTEACSFYLYLKKEAYFVA